MRSSNSDILCGAGFVAIGLAYGVQLEGLTGVSWAFPLALIILVLAGGLYFLGKGWWKWRSQASSADKPVEKTAWLKVGVIALASAMYALLVPIVGFFCTTALFSFASYLLLYEKSTGIRHAILVGALFSVSFTLLVWVSFTKLLHVPAPVGLFL